MTDASIFVSRDGRLERLTEAGFVTEDSFQALLAEHPELLGGDQIDELEPRRWLLVGREVGIADGEAASDRWSIDHVFVDQDAIPTFVEVKRRSDSRLRREVVGQLVEYIANASRYWQPGHLQMVADRTANAAKLDLSQLVSNLLEDAGLESGSFWARADENLKEGRVRLIFVADEIPSTLHRMVEFLNDQMTHTEVLAIEVRQYVGTSGISALVPYVKNATAKAQDVKRLTRRRNRWSENDFVEHLRRSASSVVADAVMRVHDELRQIADSVNYGTGKIPSFSPRLPGLGPSSPITLRSNGELTINYGYIGGPFGEQQKQMLSQKFGILVGDVPFVPSVPPRYPAFDGDRWTGHAAALVSALKDAASVGPIEEPRQP